ncbi:hypothetical protein J3A83DRAFT_4194772 [Scleroderma citrinum]
MSNHPNTSDLQEHHHLLLFRLMHTINHEQELAAPMVISYLMGWQDTYHSHNYVTIFWSSFLSALLTVYPELQLAPEAGQEPSTIVQYSLQEDTSPEQAQEGEDSSDMVTLIMDSKGQLQTKKHPLLTRMRGTHQGHKVDPAMSTYNTSPLTLNMYLLKHCIPWWKIATDLKRPQETWQAAFNKFKSTAPLKSNHILSSIQYFHECECAAQQATEDDREVRQAAAATFGEIEEDMDGLVGTVPEEYSKEAPQTGLSWQEDMHAWLAIKIAKLVKVFPDDKGAWDVSHGVQTKIASGMDLHQLQYWKEQMDCNVNMLNEADCLLTHPVLPQHNPLVYSMIDGGALPAIHLLTNDNLMDIHPSLAIEKSEAVITSADPSMLTNDQFRAYDIIAWHLDQMLAGAKVPPLWQFIHREGGTGKLKVIQQSLIYTGIAASLIEGKTTHTIAMIRHATRGKPLSNESKYKLQEFWKHYTYLIINEISMILKSFLALLSHMISITKASSGKENQGDSFRGINVIICEDLHQFPPVAAPLHKALYFPANSQRDSVGCLKEEHLKMLQGLVLRSPDCPLTDFNSSPWNEACLVTLHHAVQTMWNKSALRRHCWETGKQKQHQELASSIEIAIGMKVMVMSNIETDLDVANGTQETIVDVFLHSEESYSEMSGQVILTSLPLFILVKLDHTRTSALEGLEEGVILVKPSTKFMQINV